MNIEPLKRIFICEDNITNALKGCIQSYVGRIMYEDIINTLVDNYFDDVSSKAPKDRDINDWESAVFEFKENAYTLFTFLPDHIRKMADLMESINSFYTIVGHMAFVTTKYLDCEYKSISTSFANATYTGGMYLDVCQYIHGLLVLAILEYCATDPSVRKQLLKAADEFTVALIEGKYYADTNETMMDAILLDICPDMPERHPGVWERILQVLSICEDVFADKDNTADTQVAPAAAEEQPGDVYAVLESLMADITRIYKRLDQCKAAIEVGHGTDKKP